MKINSVRLVAVAAAVVAAGGALAINISSTTTAPVYASELIYSAAAPIASQVASTVLGFGVSGSQNRYVRLDLTNATWAEAVGNINTPLTPTPVFAGGAPSVPAGFANSSWVSGGATGTSSAIFQITANPAGQSPTDVVSMQLPKLAVTSNGAAVSITYQLFETAGAAVANAGALFSASGSLASFKTGLAVTTTASAARTTVATGYTKWATTAASAAANTASLGTIAIAVPATATPKARDGATNVALTDFLAGTGHTLSVTGDFSAAVASGVYLGQSADGAVCAPLVPAAHFTLDSAKTTATLAIPSGLASSPFGAGGKAQLCYTVTGTTVIPLTTYSATPALSFLTIASGVSGTQPTAASIGSTTRDGTTLQAPFVQVPAGYLVRFVLTNTGTTAAAYTGTVTAGPSNVTGGTANAVATNGTLTGTVPAGGQAIIEGASLPTFTTSARGFAVFTVAGTNDTINGVYQITNPTTGAVSNMNMVRPVSVYGAQVQ